MERKQRRKEAVIAASKAMSLQAVKQAVACSLSYAMLKHRFKDIFNDFITIIV